MLKTTLAIMRHCHELLRGSEYVQGKYDVCTYVLREVTSHICVYIWLNYYQISTRIDTFQRPVILDWKRYIWFSSPFQCLILFLATVPRNYFVKREPHFSCVLEWCCWFSAEYLEIHQLHFTWSHQAHQTHLVQWGWGAAGTRTRRTLYHGPSSRLPTLCSQRPFITEGAVTVVGSDQRSVWGQKNKKL